MSNKGDIYDVKEAFAAILRSTKFTDALAAAVAEKEGVTYSPNTLTVYTYEPMVKQLFPMAEVLGYSGAYGVDTDAKQVRWRIGVRWTVNEDNEAAATRNVELLARATVDVLWDDAQSNGGLLSNHDIGAGPVSITEEDYSPLLAPAASIFIRAVVVILELETERD
jgi:hypothetical protein